jgi:hypothetical protein
VVWEIAGEDQASNDPAVIKRATGTEEARHIVCTPDGGRLTDDGTRKGSEDNCGPAPGDVVWHHPVLSSKDGLGVLSMATHSLGGCKFKFRDLRRARPFLVLRSFGASTC